MSVMFRNKCLNSRNQMSNEIRKKKQTGDSNLMLHTIEMHKSLWLDNILKSRVRIQKTNRVGNGEMQTL